jgi:hypothetical protein
MTVFGILIFSDTSRGLSVKKMLWCGARGFHILANRLSRAIEKFKASLYIPVSFDTFLVVTSCSLISVFLNNPPNALDNTYRLITTTDTRLSGERLSRSLPSDVFTPEETISYPVRDLPVSGSAWYPTLLASGFNSVLLIVVGHIPLPSGIEVLRCAIARYSSFLPYLRD